MAKKKFKGSSPKAKNKEFTVFNYTDNIIEDIEQELIQLKNQKGYAYSPEAIDAENNIFDRLRTQYGWDWRLDTNAAEYFEKATDEERLQYVLDNYLEMKKKNQEHQHFIKTQLSWENTVNKILEVLK